MRISDWSSDVCSSDLLARFLKTVGQNFHAQGGRAGCGAIHPAVRFQELCGDRPVRRQAAAADRKSVVEGESVSVGVDLGGGGIIKKKRRDTGTHVTDTQLMTTTIII